MVRLAVRHEAWPVRGIFTISRGSRTQADVVVAELRDSGKLGRGECLPYARYGETIEGVVGAIEELRGAIEGGTIDREDLQSVLPPGAARNALDCAFLDLEAKRSGRRVWEALDLPAPGPVVTAYTLSIDSAENMGRVAAENASRPILKLKLSGPDDLERVTAVHRNAPEARLVVDANEAWSPALYRELAPQLVELGVVLVEQPLPADADAALAELARPVPVCADESCHDRASLDRLQGRYDWINIKLDKAGGLTEALTLKRAAGEMGFGIMVGSMLTTSLAIAPAVLLAQGAGLADLDGPLLIEDRPGGLRYEDSVVYPPGRDLWG